MIAAAALLIAVCWWLTGPTFGADPALAGTVARMALCYLFAAEVARQVVPA